MISEGSGSLDVDHLTNFYYNVTNIEKDLAKLEFAQKMIIQKKEGHFEQMIGHNKQIAIFSIIEAAVMAVILVIQLFYIKSLISK